MNEEHISSDVLREEVVDLLAKSVGSDAAREICDYYMFIECVRYDVEETSAWHGEGYYGIEDVKLAIGRVLLEAIDLADWF